MSFLLKEKYKEQSSQRRVNHNRRNMSFSNNQVCINLIITSTNQIICFSFVRLRWKISVCSKSSAKRLRDLDHLVLQVLQLPDLDFQLKAGLILFIKVLIKVLLVISNLQNFCLSANT